MAGIGASSLPALDWLILLVGFIFCTCTDKVGYLFVHCFDRGNSSVTWSLYLNGFRRDVTISD